MPFRLQLLVDRVRHVRFHIELVEARRMRPERSVEMQRLYARPSERLVQIRIPLGPEFHDVQEGLKDRLLLVVAARRAEGQKRLALAEHDRRRQGITRTRSRPELSGT